MLKSLRWIKVMILDHDVQRHYRNNTEKSTNVLYTEIIILHLAVLYLVELDFNVKLSGNIYIYLLLIDLPIIKSFGYM